jgi:hypothetical protein
VKDGEIADPDLERDLVTISPQSYARAPVGREGTEQRSRIGEGAIKNKNLASRAHCLIVRPPPPSAVGGVKLVSCLAHSHAAFHCCKSNRISPSVNMQMSRARDSTFRD